MGWSLGSIALAGEPVELPGPAWVHPGSVSQLAPSGDGARLLSVGAGRAVVFRVNDGAALWVFGARHVRSGDISADGSRVLLVTDEGLEAHQVGALPMGEPAWRRDLGAPELRSVRILGRTLDVMVQQGSETLLLDGGTGEARPLPRQPRGGVGFATPAGWVTVRALAVREEVHGCVVERRPVAWEVTLDGAPIRCGGVSQADATDRYLALWGPELCVVDRATGESWSIPRPAPTLAYDAARIEPDHVAARAGAVLVGWNLDDGSERFRRVVDPATLPLDGVRNLVWVGNELFGTHGSHIVRADGPVRPRGPDPWRLVALGDPGIAGWDQLGRLWWSDGTAPPSRLAACEMPSAELPWLDWSGDQLVVGGFRREGRSLPEHADVLWCDPTAGSVSRRWAGKATAVRLWPDGRLAIERRRRERGFVDAAGRVEPWKRWPAVRKGRWIGGLYDQSIAAGVISSDGRAVVVPLSDGRLGRFEPGRAHRRWVWSPGGAPRSLHLGGLVGNQIVVHVNGASDLTLLGTETGRKHGNVPLPADPGRADIGLSSSPHGRWLVAVLDGVVRWRVDGERLAEPEVFHVAGDFVRVARVADDGTVWVATERGQLLRLLSEASRAAP